MGSFYSEKIWNAQGYDIKALDISLGNFTINAQGYNSRVIGAGYHSYYGADKTPIPWSRITNILGFIQWSTLPTSWKTIIEFKGGYLQAYRDSVGRNNCRILWKDGTNYQWITNIYDNQINNYTIHIFFSSADYTTFEYPEINKSGQVITKINFTNLSTTYEDKLVWFSSQGTSHPQYQFLNSFSYSAGSSSYNVDMGDVYGRYRRLFWGDENPNFEYDNSKEQGGKGSYKYKTDDIDFPPLPPNNVFSTSLLTAYQLNLSQLNDYADFLWSDNFIENVKKLMNDPMQAVISLATHRVPNLSTQTAEVYTGKLDTGVEALRIFSQWVEVDCGSLALKEFWGTVMDYAPHTSVSLYLPYCSVQTLAIDEVMNTTLSIKYHIDMVSGCCIAYVKVTKANGVNSVLYTFNGNVLSELPLSNSNHSEQMKGILSSFLDAGKGAMLGGAMGGLPGAVVGASGGVVGGVVQSAMYKTSSQVQRAGSIATTFGVMNLQKPFLIVERPVQSLPENYSALRGFPSNIYKNLSDMSGYTEVEAIHLENISCTDSERNEIERLLKSGVIL